MLFPDKLQELKIYSPHFSFFYALSPRFRIVLPMAVASRRFCKPLSLSVLSKMPAARMQQA